MAQLKKCTASVHADPGQNGCTTQAYGTGKRMPLSLVMHRLKSTSSPPPVFAYHSSNRMRMRLKSMFAVTPQAGVVVRQSQTWRLSSSGISQFVCSLKLWEVWAATHSAPIVSFWRTNPNPYFLLDASHPSPAMQTARIIHPIPPASPARTNPKTMSAHNLIYAPSCFVWYLILWFLKVISMWYISPVRKVFQIKEKSTLGYKSEEQGKIANDFA